jgi:hypothetical protein
LASFWCKRLLSTITFGSPQSSGTMGKLPDRKRLNVLGQSEERLPHIPDNWDRVLRPSSRYVLGTREQP